MSGCGGPAENGENQKNHSSFLSTQQVANEIKENAAKQGYIWCLLKQKTAKEVSDVILRFIYLFGPPTYLQTYNGNEFNNAD